MRWPWVSRAAVEVAQRAEYRLARDVLDLKSSLDHERARYDKAMEHNRELVRQIVSMKREGFVVQPPPTVVPPVQESESDKAIREIAGRNGGLRRHLIQWRDTQRAEGKEEKTLADEIRHWRGGDTESAD